MKRPIKFRGRVPDSDKLDGGKIVFGSLVDYGDNWSYRFWINPTGGDRNFPVEEDSIAQFVGYDAAGNEIYEGDIFVVPCGTEIAARIFDNITPNAKLKENQ